MSGDPVVYRSSHPDVLAAWALGQQALAEYHERRRTLLASWGFGADAQCFVSQSAFGGQRFHGVEWPRSTEPPTNWRRDGYMIVPRRSSKAGKQLGSEFDSLVRIPSPRADLRQLGMPDMHMHGEHGQMYACSYAARRVDDVVWVRWNTDPAGVDESIWERVKLSDYYAMAESGSDPFAERVSP